MAKCVTVCRSDEHTFERRQLPLEIDDNLTVSKAVTIKI